MPPLQRTIFTFSKDKGLKELADVNAEAAIDGETGGTEGCKGKVRLGQENNRKEKLVQQLVDWGQAKTFNGEDPKAKGG